MALRRLLIAFSTPACVAWLLISGALLLPVCRLLKRRWFFRLFDLQSRAVYAGLAPALVRVEIVRRERGSGQPAIYVANHQSVLDPFVFSKLGLSPVVCVAKGWPFRLPFYGRYLRRMGFINSEECDFEETCRIVREQLERGVGVVFFPEGSRRRSLGRFHSLPFHAALRLNARVVPVCIRGHGELLPPKRYLPRPSSVRYTMLPALDPRDFQGDGGALRFAQTAKALIAAELERPGEKRFFH